MVDSEIAGGLIVAVGRSGLVQSLRDEVIDFLTAQAENFASDEVKKRLETLRSDGKLNKQIQEAFERAVTRWAEDSPDNELIEAVTKTTTFIDLPTMQKAVRYLAKNPFDKTSIHLIKGGFKGALPSRFEEERVERGVFEFLEFLREEYIAIPALHSTLQTAASITTANAVALLPNLEALLGQLVNGPSATEATLQTYLTWVINQHRYLDPKGTLQTTRQVQVFLDEVYVSLQAEEEEPLKGIDRKFYEDELKAFEERTDLRPEEREDFLENIQAKFSQKEEKSASGKPIELTELARSHNAMVILGDPGAGKTTLLRYLALHHALAKRKEDDKTDELGKVYLPLYLRIAEYAEHGGGRALEDFLITHIRGRDHSDKTLANLVQTSLQMGECIVFLDGLDEVIEPSQRAEISAQINSFIRTYEPKGNRFVVTSRVAGYRTAPLDGGLAHYRVQDMNPEQIERFLNKWCNAVERFQTPALSVEAQQANAQKEIESITEAIKNNAGVRRLAANPLLLRTLALIHKTGARIPQRRIELYRLAADTLIRDWNLSKGIPQEALARDADANRLLAELAAWIHENRPAGLATEGDIKQKLCESIAPLRGKEPDHPDVQTEASDFLNKIRQHTGLFVERAPKRYGFMHLTFEEYFTARWLVAKPKEAAKRIRNKLHRPRWEEPILLAIAFYGMEFPDDVTELVAEAILGEGLGGASPFEEILFRDAFFALRATGDQDVDVGLTERLVKQFVELYVNVEGSGKYQALRSQANHLIAQIHSSQSGKRMTAQFLLALKDENAQVRDSAASALRNATVDAEGVSVLLSALKDENAQVRARAAYALSNPTVDAEVMRGLLSALKDESESVRDRAALALSNATVDAEVMRGLLSALKDENAQVRASAANALSNATVDAEGVSVLLSALKDENAQVRASAAYALRNATGDAEVMRGLLSALKDENAQVRDSAASALRNATGDAEVMRGLLSALKDENAGVRARAASALRNATADAEVMRGLLSALKDENAGVRDSAALALSNATVDAEVMRGLLSALKDENADVRGSAASALRNATVDAEGVSVLLSALKDENAQVRARAAYALSNPTVDAEVMRGLLSALKDESESVRDSAALALSNATVDAEVMRGLLSALKDENAQVRARAALALSNATADAEVMRGLLSALKDENAEVRARAALALRNATVDAEGVSVLLSALKDENAQVRASAASALMENAKRFNLTQMPELPAHLSHALALGGLDAYSFGRDNSYLRAFDRIFMALQAVAPYPKV